MIAAILTALWTLRGKQTDNISSDQAAFRKDLMERISVKEAESAAFNLRVIALELRVNTLEHQNADLKEENAGLKTEKAAFWQTTPPPTR